MMFDSLDHRDHEQVTYFSDEETGLQAIVAIHDTRLGPSLGGTRMRDYESEDAALKDVLRLSNAMTFKAAAADLDLGGGKAVIIGDSKLKDEAFLRSYGRAIDRLGGRYITSVDVNTTVEDMDVIKEETDHVVGTSNGLGDPSPVTAHGALHAIGACVEFVYGKESMDGIHVAVQGIGKVGGRLAADLAKYGADVTVTDIDATDVEAFVAEHGVDSVPTDEIYDVSCDVFAPCAFGGAVNDDTISRLDCDIVAGAANNILDDETRHAAELKARDILYAPDYVVNAGGLITVAKEYTGGTREDAFTEAEAIGDRLLTMMERAEAEDTTVLKGAQRYVEDRLEGSGRPMSTLAGD